MSAEPASEASACVQCDGKTGLSCGLSQSELGWLEQMSTRFELPAPPGKAVRCCLNFAAQAAPELPSPPAAELTAVEIPLAPSQLEWLESRGDPAAALRAALAAAMAAEPEEVFAVVRCKTKTKPALVT